VARVARLEVGGWLVSCDQSWASAAGDLPGSALLRRFPEKTEPISPEVRHKDSHLRADADDTAWSNGPLSIRALTYAVSQVWGA
jgi:hypothetical protein